MSIYRPDRQRRIEKIVELAIAGIGILVVLGALCVGGFVAGAGLRVLAALVTN